MGNTNIKRMELMKILLLI